MPDTTPEMESTTATSIHEKPSSPSDVSQTMKDIEDPEFSILILPPYSTEEKDSILLEHVTKADTVLSLRQLIAEYPTVAAYTCYRLEVVTDDAASETKNSAVCLHEYVELGEYPQIVDKVKVRMILEQYDARKVRAHIRRLRDIMMNPPIPQTIHSETSKNSIRKASSKTSDSQNASKSISKKKKSKSNGKASLHHSAKGKSVSPLPASLAQSQNANGTEKESLVDNEKKQHQHPAVLEKIQIPIQSDLTDFYEMSMAKVAMTEKDPSNQDLNAESITNIAKLPVCIKSIVHSGYNPPPTPRKLVGDLLYLEVCIEGEDKELFITAHVDGFYVNRSTRDRFDPAPRENAACHDHLLLNVLCKASPKFDASYKSLLAKAADLAKEGPASIEWMIAAGSNVGGKLPWLTSKSLSNTSHRYDPNRAEDEICTSFGMDERGSLRDWNEEYQCCRELPKATLRDQIIRSRVMYKIVNEFVDAATQGAVAIVEGHIPPINPMDEHNAYVYVFNSIFFSLSIDGKPTNKDSLTSNEESGYYSANRDMLGLKAINEADVDGLYTLATAIVDYMGMRVVAQSVIPGILQGEASSKLVYGSVDGGKSIAVNPKMHKLMLEAGSKLHLAEREIQPLGLDNETTNASGAASTTEEAIGGEAVTTPVKICGPVESKGILGSDGRLYVLDLVRITPKDCTIYDEKANAGESSSGPFDAERNGYVALLRPELIKLYVLWKQNKLRREKLAAEAEAKANDSTAATVKDKNKSTDSRLEHPFQQDSPKKKVDASTDLAENLEMRPIQFNPNVFMKYGASTDGQQAEEDEKLARDVANYLQKVVIPAFVTDLHRGAITPADGYSLTQLMHSCGINMRYLGRLATLTRQLDANDNNIRYIIELLETEMISRAAKHLLAYILNSDNAIRSAPGNALLSVLNAIFGCCLRPTDNTEHEQFDLENMLSGNANAQSSNESKKNENPFPLIENGEPDCEVSNDSCLALDSSAIWSKLHQLIKKRFSYTLCMWGPKAQAQGSVQVHPNILLRRICQRLGLHVYSQKYDFQSATPFKIDDISGVSPVVKHSLPDHPLPQAKQLLERGRFHLTTGSLASAYELLQEASALLFQVCGAAHEDAALCSSSLATVLYHAGDLTGAISQQQRALALYTQLKGIDYHDTAFAHANLALFLHANKDTAAAILHIRRSIYLLELCGGPYFPELSSLYFKMGMICQDAGIMTLAVPCLRESLRRGGLDGLQAANTLHHMALASASAAEYREALAYEKRVYGIYREYFGEKDAHTMETANYMARFTQKAVEGAKDRRQVDAAAAADAIAKQLLLEAEMSTKVGEKKKTKKGKQVSNKSVQ